MKSEIINVRTGGRETVRDITGECASFAQAASGGGDGLLHVFVPHATAGVFNQVESEVWHHSE
jgi:thiamine phosphate synthase YjbQ (UPF0047 family)